MIALDKASAADTGISFARETQTVRVDVTVQQSDKG